MEDELLNERVESIEDAGAHLRGEPVDVRVTFVGEPDLRAIRRRMTMTQQSFAELLCISVDTLREWEQGRRDPSGPAMRLPQIVDKHPELLPEAGARRDSSPVPLPPGAVSR